MADTDQDMSAAEHELEISGYPVDEYLVQPLREAIHASAAGRVTWLTNDGVRFAAIVPIAIMPRGYSEFAEQLVSMIAEGTGAE